VGTGAGIGRPPGGAWMDIPSIAVLVGSLAALGWAADVFVVSASNMGRILRLPKMVVGIVLVGFATTAPELAVSVQSAYLGHPEIALGNALGSVMADDGLAMALAALLATSPILIDPRILKSAGLFLIAIDLVAYGLAWNGHVARAEGVVLMLLLAGYYALVLRTERRRWKEGRAPELAEGHETPLPCLRVCVMKFVGGLVGVVIASRFIIWSATNIARSMGVTEAVIGLTVIAFGTSLPEIGTCVAAARRGEGQIAVGDIVGADILNVLWVIGMSAAVSPITVPTNVINFAFPWMLAIVLTMLVCMRIGYRLTRPKGVLLIALYAAYIASAVRWFY